jgi:hypothetical protein
VNPFDLVSLTALVERTGGGRGVSRWPNAMNHPDLTENAIREVSGKMSGTCMKISSTACLQRTFVAKILCAKRGSTVPALCPNCTFLAYPIFTEGFGTFVGFTCQ